MRLRVILNAPIVDADQKMSLSSEARSTIGIRYTNKDGSVATDGVPTGGELWPCASRREVGVENSCSAALRSAGESSSLELGRCILLSSASCWYRALGVCATFSARFIARRRVCRQSRIAGVHASPLHCAVNASILALFHNASPSRLQPERSLVESDFATPLRSCWGPIVYAKPPSTSWCNDRPAAAHGCVGAPSCRGHYHTPLDENLYHTRSTLYRHRPHCD